MPDTVLLRAGGTALLLDARGPGLPVVVHWGADPGELPAAEQAAWCDGAVPAVPSSSLDEPVRVGLLPEHATGYPGRAVLAGTAGARGWSPAFATTDLTVSECDGTQVLELAAVDAAAGLRLRTELLLAPTGLVQVRHAVTNAGDSPYQLAGLPAVLPVPARASELLDLTGRHLRERSPQRLPLGHGAWVREQRRGRPGHDAPLVLVAGTAGFGWRHGEVWGVHVAWSGDTTTYAERLPLGWAGIGGGELLIPGEVVLAPGEGYLGPWLWFARSDAGLDGIAAAFTDTLRARPGHPTTARPVILNTWEAVYFDHDLDRLRALADLAAEVGVERFVLDDGWFGGRRDATAGLGDWYVSGDAWPDGLHPLVDHVTGLGMQFGLWVEPEMVNPDSDLVRAHPDWVLQVPGRTPRTARHQQVLNLAQPGVSDHLLERLDALLDEYDISYLKWDHNRDLLDAGAATADGRRPGVHGQVLALYALLDELRGRHPGVEVESCAGGGGRVDLAILQRTDRVWASDCNDPLERQHIQRWTGLLLAPELVGAHVGPPRAHTTGRVTDLAFRAGTALFGHFGIEWDLAAASAAERAELAAWVATYRRLRPLLHSGRGVRADPAGDGTWVHGVVAPDAAEALYAYVRLQTGTPAVPDPVRLPGLHPDRRYRVEPLLAGTAPALLAVPPWWTAGGVTLPGRVLGDAGLAAPLLGPAQLVLLHVTAA